MRTYYWSAIVSMVLSCTIFELFDVERMYYVSDTIRKPPLVEAQTASGKQKNTFCRTRVGLSVQLPKFH